MPQMALFVRTPEMARTYAKSVLVHYGWKTQWGCLNKLWTNESNFRPDAINHTPVYLMINGKWVKFYAGGIPQRIGLNPKSNIPTQVKVGLNYIEQRYSSPCQALRFWNKNFWY
jgi:hypothetical protein